MRTPIWKSTDFFEFTNGARHDMSVDAIEFPEEGVHAVPNFDFSKLPQGEVRDLKVEDGDLTGETSWHDPEANYDSIIESGEVRLGGMYDRVEYNEDKTVVTKCRLVCVSLILASNVPGYNDTLPIISEKGHKES